MGPLLADAGAISFAVSATRTGGSAVSGAYLRAGVYYGNFIAGAQSNALFISQLAIAGGVTSGISSVLLPDSPHADIISGILENGFEHAPEPVQAAAAASNALFQVYHAGTEALISGQ